MELAARQRMLEESLSKLGSVLVAYSGGADSALLAFVAHRVLGSQSLAVIADSASLPRAELAAALRFAQEAGFPVRVIHTGELASEAYRRNAADRCFHCKDELFRAMETLREELGFAAIAYGMNADDRGEFRPGQQAAALHHAHAPLAAAGLTKTEVRNLLRSFRLSVAEKPASACLASRIAYGQPVTEQALVQVEQAEAALHSLGFRQLRVRHHGEIARIELASDELPRALSPEMLARMAKQVRAAGFLYITLDLEGYRSGSMNASLLSGIDVPLSALPRPNSRPETEGGAASATPPLKISSL